MENVFEKAKAKYGVEKFYAGLSGGKDSITAADVSDKLGYLNGCFFIDTTIGLPETQQFVKDYCQERGWPLTILSPKMSYEQFIMRYGFPTVRFHGATMGKLKFQPMRDFIKSRPEKSAIISGIRRYESRRRGRNIDGMMKDGKMIFVAPIAEWTTEKVWAYIKENNLPRSPAYKTIEMSGDCLCGAFADAREANILRIFHPKIAEEISRLESVCPKKHNRWGNTNMSETKSQKTMDDWVCGACSVGAENLIAARKKEGLYG